MRIPRSSLATTLATALTAMLIPLAAPVAAFEATSAVPVARIVVGGDLNFYPRPDDPFTTPSDQLGPLYDAGLTNLYDLVVSEVPASAYSYVFDAQAQTLDHQFVTNSMLPELIMMRAAHINSDWPADHPGDGARGISDHDPQVALHSLEPTADRHRRSRRDVGGSRRY